FAQRIAVTSGTALDLASRGYEVVRNDDPAEGLGRSVRLGVAAAQATGAAYVMLALADMPRVTATHIYRLLDRAEDENSIAASSDGIIPRPPVLFGSAHFETLMQSSGDTGARDLVRAGRHVVTSPA